MELKPCPFCGGKANLVEASLAAKVVCIGCGAETGYHYDFGPDRAKNAVEHWNTRAETAIDVLCAIDQLRRDLSGYHGQLKAHDDLQRHCDNQRKRIGELEVLYAGAKAEVAELKEQTRWIAQTDSRWEAAVRDLEQVKAENARLREEIVRCKDCIGLVETWDGWECERFSGEYHRAEPDGFCAWGERRDDHD